MVEIKIIREYRNCYKVGDTKLVQPHFAAVLIGLGYAKAMKKPPKNKMIEKPEKEK